MPEQVNYDGLPSHMRKGARQWVEEGIMTGEFLTSVMENNLVGAYIRADDDNSAAMVDWADWLYNEAPNGCWGNKPTIREWRKMHENKRADQRQQEQRDLQTAEQQEAD